MVTAFVVVLVKVNVKPVGRRLACGDHLDASVLDAACREDALGKGLQLVGRSLEDDSLEAVRLVQVNVQARTHLATQHVLELVQALREASNVVVVDDRDGRDGVTAARHLVAGHLRASEIAKHLRARAPSLLHERVERPQE